MQDNTYLSAEQSLSEGTRPTTSGCGTSSGRGLGKSIGGALLLLTLDVAWFGTFMFSMIVCPVWFLVSIVKNAIQRPGWIVALIRIAIPAVTLKLALVNDNVQYRIGKANAPKIIAACEAFHAANGEYPKTLAELVPQYMPAVPRAKYCLEYGDFLYLYGQDHPKLVWFVIPPHGRKVYDFDNRRWGYLD